MLKLASLFDGSGGFPLAAQLVGIEPIWNSEIEPFPCRVTEIRFPKMRNYGDVSKINGAEVEPVDILTFGSPCQDLSLAGKQVGLEGSRSSLFFQALRIIKEMRKKTNGKYPRFAVWENVTGAFTSNNGADFYKVIETFCKTANKKLYVPRPKRWAKAGEVLDKNFSLCWRTFNACYWGVPQARRRIYLVTDFASQCARKILLEQNTASESFKRFRQAQYENSTSIEKSARNIKFYNWSLFHKTAYETSVTGTMTACRNLRAFTMGLGGTMAVENGRARYITPIECARLQGFPDYWGDGLEDKNPSIEEIEKWRGIFATYGKQKTNSGIKKWLAKSRSDSAEYKMWGNGVALPCVCFVLEGIKRLVENE